MLARRHRDLRRWPSCSNQFLYWCLILSIRVQGHHFHVGSKRDRPISLCCVKNKYDGIWWVRRLYKAAHIYTEHNNFFILTAQSLFLSQSPSHSPHGREVHELRFFNWVKIRCSPLFLDVLLLSTWRSAASAQSYSPTATIDRCLR